MSGDDFEFDRLALCVGARARRLMMPGADLPGVLYLRNADDALQLKARVPMAQRAVVIGGGFIGIEAAASLTKLGVDVVLVEAGARLLERPVGEETSAFILDHHRREGIDIRLGASVTRIVSDGDRVGGVEVDGELLPADIVLIGVGVVPNTELAQTMGLVCDNGIVVDRYSVASDGTTLAVGDVANLPNPIPGAPPGDRIRFESVNNAVEQAKVAAYALMGRAEEYVSVPWFWSNQGELKLQIAGLSRGYDQTVVRRDDERGKFSVLYYRKGRIVAADAINTPLDFMAVKNALAAQQNIPANEAADPAVPLKGLARDA
jgi:3-phenylpropionate/trans-cinnamate dioxygenase ferredoxin reductase subunit